MANDFCCSRVFFNQNFDSAIFFDRKIQARFFLHQIKSVIFCSAWNRSSCHFSSLQTVWWYYRNLPVWFFRGRKRPPPSQVQQEYCRVQYSLLKHKIHFLKWWLSLFQIKFPLTALKMSIQILSGSSKNKKIKKKSKNGLTI